MLLEIPVVISTLLTGYCEVTFEIVLVLFTDKFPIGLEEVCLVDDEKTLVEEEARSVDVEVSAIRTYFLPPTVDMADVGIISVSGCSVVLIDTDAVIAVLI